MVKETMKKNRLLSLIFTCLILGMMFMPKAKAAEAAAPAGRVTTASTALNVRSGASTSAAVVASLAKDSYVRLLEKNGIWYKVEYSGGRYGYASANYITEVGSAKEATVNTSSGGLNVRTGPSTANGIKTVLAKGTAVVVLSESNGWANIVYNGTQTGYVSASYLKYNTASVSSGYAAVKLSGVPNFKQTDSRWAAVTLGTSGKSIASIGCATTALAMTESYRLGYTINPADMSKRLSYSASGSLYWPTNYVHDTGSGYLKTMYENLKKGIPTIYASTNAYGGSHFVVVTGFKGGSLAASNFIINDPGSNSRVTLDQHIAAYPNFYKLVFYR